MADAVIIRDQVPTPVYLSGGIGPLGPAGPAGDVAKASDRTALAAIAGMSAKATRYLAEVGREGLFVFDSSNLSAMVTADTAQGLYVPPASDPTGASGAWVRKFDGFVNVRWFGATGDGVTNDGAAFVAAIVFLKATAVATSGYYAAAKTLFVPAGHYYLGTTTLEIRHTLTIAGEGGLGFGAYATKLRWAANTTGIRIQAFNTSGATTIDGTPKGSGGWTHLKRLQLTGAYVNAAATPEGEYHGIHTKQRIFIDDVTVENFQGDGLHADGGTSVNTNLSKVSNFVSNGNRDGRYVAGADANVWAFRGCSYESNRRFGVNENSFIGNAEYDSHSNGNAVTPENDGTTLPASIVSYNGRRYGVVPGQDVGASTNAPSGTTADNSWWYYIEDGGVVSGRPAWVSGIATRAGGAYFATNSRNVFFAPYVEQGEIFYGKDPTIVVGNTGAWALKGGAVPLKTYFGTLAANGGLSVFDYYNSGTTALNFYASDGSTAVGTVNVNSTVGMTLRGKQTLSLGTYDDGEIAQVIDGYLYFTGTAFGINHVGTLKVNGASGVKLQYNGTDQLTIGSGTATFAGTVAATNIGTAAAATLDTDTTLGANSDTRVASQKAVKAYIAQQVAGLLDFKGNQDCSANPNYPAASKGDAYYVSVAGKIGGGSGKSVDIGDVIIASADNAGGTEASVGTSWFVLEHNLTGALIASNNLSDLTNPTTARGNLGLAAIAASGSASDLATGTILAARMPAHTGDVTSSVGTVGLTIAANAVTFSKFVAATAAGVVGASAAGNFSQLGLAGGITVSGGNLTLGAITPTGVASTGDVTTSSATGKFGYATGAGGAVTQLTSRTTGVTLNKPTGTITLFSTTTTAGLVTTFTVTNSQVAANDTINVSVQSGTGIYLAFVTKVAAGSFNVSVYTPAAVGSAEAPVINFAVVKAVNA